MGYCCSDAKLYPTTCLCNPTDCAHQAPLSMGFFRQEYWSGLPFPSPGDLPIPGIKPTESPALAGGFFTTEPPGKPTLEFQKKNIDQGMEAHQEKKVKGGMEKKRKNTPGYLAPCFRTEIGRGSNCNTKCAQKKKQITLTGSCIAKSMKTSSLTVLITAPQIEFLNSFRKSISSLLSLQ